MNVCFMCGNKKFESVFVASKLKVFSSLKKKSFSMGANFDAQLWRCMRCGFVQQRVNRGLKKFLTDFYKNPDSFPTLPPGESDFGDAVTDRYMQFLTQFMHKAPKKILEIGCYDGYFLSQLQKKFQAEAFGIEISPQKNTAHNITIYNDYYPSSATTNKSFDLVVLLNVLEHVFDPHAFMQAVKNNTSNEGVILIGIPQYETSLKAGAPFYLHQHISYFTPKTFKMFLFKLGLEVKGLQVEKEGLLCLCQKSQPPTTPKTIDVDNSSKCYAQYFQRLVDKFRSLTSMPGKKVGLYGACNVTHNLLQICQMFDGIHIYDGDTRKQKKYMSDINEPVSSWEEIDRKKLDTLIIMPLAFTEEIYTFLSNRNLKTKIIKLFDNDFMFG